MGDPADPLLAPLPSNPTLEGVPTAVAAGSPLAQKAKIDLKDLEPMFFVGMLEKAYPGSNVWLIDACREAGFTPPESCKMPTGSPL